MKAPLPRGTTLALIAAAVAALQARAVFTEAINWDEFALLDRVQAFLRVGQLQGGGRPGLVELVLAPFARGCEDAVSTLRVARLLWLGITAALLAAVYVLARRLRRTVGFDAGAALAVAVLGCVPVFLRWSLQVRTDQPALALAAWGGVALLANRRPSALLGGLLVGAGALFSQKAVYAGALVGLLAVLDWWRAPDFGERRSWQSVAERAGLFLLGGALALVAYRYVLPLFVQLPRTVMTLERGLDVFAHYRRMFGFVVYRRMLPTLVPQLALLGALVLASVRFAREPKLRRAVISTWAVLALGLAVGLFHAAAFPYFWMTLGLFPALAAALAFEPLTALVPDEQRRRWAWSGLLMLLLGPAAWTSLSLQEDTQVEQRDSLTFIARNFPEPARGFQAEGALACRKDPAPFPVYFTEHIARRFSGPERAVNIAALEHEFRSRPVEFIVATHVFHQFPQELRDFWGAHYVPYGAQVFVPGRVMSGRAGTSASFETFRSGRYRWFVPPGAAGGRLAVDGRALHSGEIMDLAAGTHRLQLVDAAEAGLFALALDEAPAPSDAPFYSVEQVREIAEAEFDQGHP